MKKSDKVSKGVAKAAGKVRKARSVLRGEGGIFATLREEHEEVSRLIKDVLDSDEGEVELRRNLFEQIRIELLSHARAEEAEFYSVLQQFDETRDLAVSAIEEHDEIEELILELESMDEDEPAWMEVFEELKLNVDHHLYQEEEHLFPRARQVLDAERSREIGHRFDERKQKEVESLESAAPVVEPPRPPAG